MKVGDVVRGLDPKRLHCGSGIYPDAIVKSVTPLILVSREGDMTWHHVRPEEIEIVTDIKSILSELAEELAECVEQDVWPNVSREQLSRLLTHVAALEAERNSLQINYDFIACASKTRTEITDGMLAELRAERDRLATRANENDVARDTLLAERDRLAAELHNALTDNGTKSSGLRGEP